MRRLVFMLILLTLVFAACAPAATEAPIATPTPVGRTTALPAPTAVSTSSTTAAFWISPAVPDKLRVAIKIEGAKSVESKAAANIWLDVADSQSSGVQSSWVYALVAAFPTVRDGITFDELKSAWSGSAQALILTESTAAALKSLFGGAAVASVKIVPAEGLTEALWQDRAAWGIVPFEAINPKMKVLEIDGASPLRKEFDAGKYPLTVKFALTGADVPFPAGVSGILPATNRDPAKLVTIVMTGVTALVRATAARMEKNGNLYPAQDIRDWLLNADIAHISDEVPFAVGCPPPNPYSMRLIFCSDPKYIELLEYVGADVIELTGNHFEDWGKAATLHTLEMYKARNWPYFGGGADLADAQKPAILERGGMKFAFIGCNPAGPTFAWARADGWPGAAPCGKAWSGAKKGGTGYEWIVDEIKQLKAEGYIVIATYQYYEYYSPDPRPWQQEDFRLLADAGATIVSGSQGHYAQAMEFYSNSFLHYGIGNLFFDQMGYTNPSSGKRTENTRREFLDRHVFYDGQYLGTELLTAMLEDYAKPRPMTPEERATFLSDYFTASGWGSGK